MIGNMVRAGALAAAVAVSDFGTAAAGNTYDGSWSITTSTDRGSCGTNYFQVQIYNGKITHANLVKLRGRVSSGGGAYVSVVVGDRTARGSGRLSGSSGRGRWSGRSGSERCSGSWTAQR